MAVYFEYVKLATLRLHMTRSELFWWSAKRFKPKYECGPQIAIYK